MAELRRGEKQEVPANREFSSDPGASRPPVTNTPHKLPFGPVLLLFPAEIAESVAVSWPLAEHETATAGGSYAQQTRGIRGL